MTVIRNHEGNANSRARDWRLWVSARRTCAWIKLRLGERLTEDDVRESCCDQIAHYKVARHIQLVEEFPMTVTGKIQKLVM